MIDERPHARRFPCSPELFKAAASFLVTAELLFAMYLSNSEGGCQREKRAALLCLCGWVRSLTRHGPLVFITRPTSAAFKTSGGAASLVARGL